MQGEREVEEKEINVGLFEIAFNQRRKINIEKLKQHASIRAVNFKERTHVLDQLQSSLAQKNQCTKLFLKELIHYFQGQITLYGSFFKAMSKPAFKETSLQIFVYPALQKSVIELTEINQAEVKDLKILTKWIEKVLLAALKSLIDNYKEEGKQKKGAMADVRGLAETARSKQMKALDKIEDSSDLFQAQLSLLDKFKSTDEAIKQWGLQLFKAWKEVLQKQSELREQIQKHIVQFHDKFTKVYIESDASKAMLKFWLQIDKAPSIYKVFESFLSEQDVAIVSRGCKSSHLKNNFQPWLNFEQEKAIASDPIKIIEILQVKLFKAKLQRSKRDYVSVILYFTIDKNMLIFSSDEQKVVLKLTQDGLRIKRISQNLIQIQGIQIGFLMNSKKKQVIHFGTMDEAEEFSFFIQKLQKSPNE